MGNSLMILVLLIVLERIGMTITLIFRSARALSWSLAVFYWWRRVLNTSWLNFSFDLFIQILCHIGYFVKVGFGLIPHDYHLVMCILKCRFSNRKHLICIILKYLESWIVWFVLRVHGVSHKVDALCLFCNYVLELQTNIV